jgi:hypothetical protein
VAEVLRMREIGILDEHYELIEGEIVLMQAKNDPRERIKLALIPCCQGIFRRSGSLFA